MHIYVTIATIHSRGCPSLPGPTATLGGALQRLSGPRLQIHSAHAELDEDNMNCTAWEGPQLCGRGPTLQTDGSRFNLQVGQRKKNSPPKNCCQPVPDSADPDGGRDYRGNFPSREGLQNGLVTEGTRAEGICPKLHKKDGF